MTPYKTYSILIAFILVAFFVGLCSAPNDSKELQKQWEKERKLLMEAVVKKQAELARKSADSLAIREKMMEDSLKFLSAYNAEKQAKLYYKRLYENIDLSRYSVHSLDSLRAALRSPLHFN